MSPLFFAVLLYSVAWVSCYGCTSGTSGTLFGYSVQITAVIFPDQPTGRQDLTHKCPSGSPVGAVIKACDDVEPTIKFDSYYEYLNYFDIIRNGNLQSTVSITGVVYCPYAQTPSQAGQAPLAEMETRKGTGRAFKKAIQAFLNNIGKDKDKGKGKEDE